MEHFNQIVRLLLKNSLLLLLLPLLAMGSLWYLTKDQPKKYEVTSKFLYDFGGKSTNVNGESLSLNEIYIEFLNTLEIVRSRKLVEKLKAKIALESLQDSSQIFSYPWSLEHKESLEEILTDILHDERTPYLTPSEVEREIEDFYRMQGLSSETIMGAISARRVQSSNFLEIKMNYDHPSKLFYMSNVFNELLTQEMGNINRRNITKQKVVIEELVRKAKKELDEKVAELENLKVQNNIINLDEHTKAIVTYQVNLEQLRGKIRQQIASTNKAEELLRSGLANQQFASVNKNLNEQVLEKKEEVYAAQDVKLVHLQKDIDYSQLIQQQKEIYQNYVTIKDNLEELSRNAVYDPTMVQTGVTMKFIDFSVKSDRLEDELVELDIEIQRVKKYASYFAPFESAISTLRDEITTAQKSYLLFLNKLNMTESMEVGASRSKLELVDHPEYPHKALPSKTKLIILTGGIAVGILLVVFIVVNYLIDNRIKDVPTFERRFNQQVVAALPKAGDQSEDPVLSRALSLIQQEGIKKIVRTIGQRKVIAIGALTTQDDTKALAEELRKYWLNEKVQFLTASGDIQELQKAVAKALKKFDRIICLSSPMQFSYDGFNSAALADCSFLHFALGRIKSSADDRIIRDYSRDVKTHEGFILSELAPEYMDTYVGELPKKRNWIRQTFKKIINRDLSWN